LENGEKMNLSKLIKTKNDEGKEDHLPHMELDKGHRSGKDIVRIVVGHGKPHPNTVEHHIAWIELYGVKKKKIRSLPWGVPYVRHSFQIQISDFKSTG
jgi:desulfoferrodoxin-like iron-binding protein